MKNVLASIVLPVQIMFTLKRIFINLIMINELVKICKRHEKKTPVEGEGYTEMSVFES